MSKKLGPYFWLAILAHLLLFFSFSLSLLNSQQLAFEKKSDRYLPAYLYQEENHFAQASASAATKPSQMQSQQEARSAENALALKKQDAKPNRNPQETFEKSKPAQKQKMGSAAFIQAESPTTGQHRDEPLLKELSRATATKLFYPPEAAAFHLKGTAVIRFLLHPDGRVTEVTLAQSSGFRILDNAALSAIQAISPVRDANLFLTKPKILLAGIIFG